MLQQLQSCGVSLPPKWVESDSVSREADVMQWWYYLGKVMGGNCSNTASFADRVMQLGLGNREV